MNESDPENEWRALQPVLPTAALEAAIARDLAYGERALAVTSSGADSRLARPASNLLTRSPEPGASWLGRLGWMFGGALAGGALAAAVLWAAPWHAALATAKPQEALPFWPLESAREIVAAQPEEAVNYADPDGPTQLVRYSSIERRVWENPATGARLEVEVPREDLLRVPVPFQ